MATATASANAATCPVWSVARATGATGVTLDELSGLAPVSSGEWWTHNDSGDSPRIFRVDEQLRVLAEVRLWCPSRSTSRTSPSGPTVGIWVADIGDNLLIRPTIVLWGLPQQSASTTVTPVTLDLVYPDGPHDAESLMIDPLTGDGFIVAKAVVGGRSNIYRIPAATFTSPPAGAFTVEPVGSIDVSDGGSIGPTAADISPSGRYVVVKTFTTTYLWPRRRGDSVVDTLAASPHAPCRVDGAGANEAIAFSLDGRRLATVSEGVGSALNTLERAA